jgi:hypothetical protein
MNEAETRAERIDPLLAAAGWGVVEGNRIRRQFSITPRRLEGGERRGNPLTADDVLTYRNTRLAVVEAKPDTAPLTEGAAQAKDYATKLQLRHHTAQALVLAPLPRIAPAYAALLLQPPGHRLQLAQVAGRAGQEICAPIEQGCVAREGQAPEVAVEGIAQGFQPAGRRIAGRPADIHQKHIEGCVAEEQAAAGVIGEGFGVERAAADGDLPGRWSVVEAATASAVASTKGACISPAWWGGHRGGVAGRAGGWWGSPWGGWGARAGECSRAGGVSCSCEWGLRGWQGFSYLLGKVCIVEHMWFTGLISACCPRTFVAEIICDTLLLQKDLVARHRWFMERIRG